MLDSRGGDAAQGGTAGVSGAPFGGTGGGAGWAGSGGTLGDAAGDQGSESGAADAPADSPHSDGPDGWSTWNPATAADCVLWLDASDPSTLNTVGPNVNSWASKCGLALGSASGTQRPVLAITNGRPTVHCDGLNDRLVIGGSGVAATQYSVLIVIDKPAGAPSQQVLWSNRGLVPPVGGTATWFGTLNGSLLVYQDSATPAAALLGTSKLDGKTAVLELAVSTLGDRAAYRDGLLEQSDSGSSGLTTLLGTSCTAPRSARRFVPDSPRSVIGVVASRAA